VGVEHLNALEPFRCSASHCVSLAIKSSCQKEVILFHKDGRAKLELFRLVDEQAELEGAGVGYIGDGACYLLRPSQHISGLSTYMVLEETTYVSMPGLRPAPPPPSKNVKSSGASRELIGVGINCTAAVLAGAAATAGAAASPLTGGASGIITLVAGAAALASAAQCGISIGRVIIELADPGSADEYLDREEWYQWSSNILDAVSLAGVIAGSPAAYENIAKIIQVRRVTGKGIAEILRGLSRQERKLIARELAQASENLSNKQWKTLVRAGKLPKIYSRTAINATVLEQLLGNVSSVLTVYGSSRMGDIALIVHVIQE